jgi:hypothetical protein
MTLNRRSHRCEGLAGCVPLAATVLFGRVQGRSSLSSFSESRSDLSTQPLSALIYRTTITLLASPFNTFVDEFNAAIHTSAVIQSRAAATRSSNEEVFLTPNS